MVAVRSKEGWVLEVRNDEKDSEDVVGSGNGYGIVDYTYWRGKGLSCIKCSRALCQGAITDMSLFHRARPNLSQQAL